MRKLLRFCFSRVSLLACSRHLKTNLLHAVTETANLMPALRSKFVRVIFGDGGLVTCIGVPSFECAVNHVRASLLAWIPNSLRRPHLTLSVATTIRLGSSIGRFEGSGGVPVSSSSVAA